VCAAALAALVTLTAFHAPVGSEREPDSDPDVGSSLRILRLHDRLAPNAPDYAAATTESGPLLLFLPATRAVPGDYRAFLHVASTAGYHVLALDYPNTGRSVAHTCGRDPHCYTAVQRNRFLGVGPGPFSRVDPANSIVSRLRLAVGALRRSEPGRGWERYLDGNGIRWDRIVLAGHSQGGGEAAYIAHLHRVAGVLMFSAPVDTDGTIAASWLRHPGATPAARMYGFDDSHDMYARRITGSWRLLGLGPPHVLPGHHARDVHIPSGSHVLLTRDRLGTPAQDHGRVITDAGPRTAAGSPLFEPVWRWMLQSVRNGDLGGS
jgi:hypothetical protein